MEAYLYNCAWVCVPYDANANVKNQDENHQLSEFLES